MGERRGCAFLVTQDIKAHAHPDVSIEVDELEAVSERARTAGAEIV